MAFWAVRTLVIQEDQSWGTCRELGLRLPRQGGGQGTQPLPGEEGETEPGVSEAAMRSRRLSILHFNVKKKGGGCQMLLRDQESLEPFRCSHSEITSVLGENTFGRQRRGSKEKSAGKDSAMNWVWRKKGDE